MPPLFFDAKRLVGLIDLTLNPKRNKLRKWNEGDSFKVKRSSFFEETYPNCPIVLLHFSHTVSFPTDRKSQKLTEKVFCNLPSCRNGNGPLESNIRSASFWPSVKLFFWLLNANSMIFDCHRDIENWDKNASMRMRVHFIKFIQFQKTISYPLAFSAELRFST